MRILVFVVLSVVLFSCVPGVQFQEPMPPKRVNLPNIPKAYRGTIEDGNESWQIGKDTVVLGDSVMVNGVDFLLRKMAGALVVNFPVPESGAYGVCIIQNDGQEMTSHFFEEDEVLLSFVDSVLSAPREVKLTSGLLSWEYHLLRPTAAEFGQMLENRVYSEPNGSCPLPYGETVKPSAWIRPTN